MNRNSTINWLWNIEHHFTFKKGYSLSRLLPTYAQFDEFNGFFPVEFLESFCLLDRYQIFLDRLTDQDRGFNYPVESYMADWSNSIESSLKTISDYNIGNSCGVPHKTDAKTASRFLR